MRTGAVFLSWLFGAHAASIAIASSDIERHPIRLGSALVPLVAESLEAEVSGSIVSAFRSLGFDVSGADWAKTYPVSSQTYSACAAAVDPLECVINQIQIGPFPEACFNISTGDTLCIRDFMCSGMDLKGIPSAYVSPTSISFGLTSLKVPCSASWSMSGSQGKLDLALADLTTTSTFNVEVADEIYPSAVTVQDCSVPSLHISMVFSGGSKVVTGLLNSLVSAMLPKVESGIKAFICQGFDTSIAAGLTSIVTKLDPALRSIVAMGPEQPPLLPQCLNWTDTAVQSIHTLLDKLEMKHDVSGDVDLFGCLSPSQTPEIAALVEEYVGFSLEDLANVQLDLDIAVPLGPAGDLHITGIDISGLDSIEDISIMAPASGAVLTTNVALNTFAVSVFATYSSAPDAVYHEDVRFDLVINDIDLGMDLVLGVNAERFYGLYLEQLLNFSCWHSTLDALSVSSLNLKMTVGTVTYMQVAGGAGTLEKDLAAIVNNAIALGTSGFGDLITSLIIGVGQGPIRSKLNEALAARLAMSNDCAPHTDTSGTDWVVWSENQFIETIDHVVNEVIGVSGVNNLMTCLTNGTGTASFSSKSGEWDLKISGLNSFYDLSILAPVIDQPYELYNAIGIGSCPTADDCNPFAISYHGVGRDSRPVSLAVFLENFHAALGILAEMDSTRIQNMELGTWQQDGCKMTTFDAISLYEFDLVASTSELYYKDGEGYRNITMLVDVLLAFVSSSKMVAKINGNIDTRLYNSTYVCAGTAVPSDEDILPGSSQGFWTLWTIVGAAAIAIAVVVCSMLLKRYLGSEKGEFVLCGSKDNLVKKYFPETWEKYQLQECFVFDQRISLTTRMGILAAVFIGMGMYMASNATPAVSVLLEIDVGGASIKPDPIFQFGLENTVRDMWNAEVYPLAILIAFFSGGWPYIKLMTMLVAWVLPPSLLSVESRQTAVVVLDALGKWSLIDAFVMVMMMVAFHVELIIAPEIAAIVSVRAEPSFHLFNTATLLSLFVGHIVLHYHHCAIETMVPPTEDKPKALIDGRIYFHHRKSWLSFTKFGKVMLILSLVACGFFIFWGTYTDTFLFEFKGLVGFLLKSDAITSYGFISTGETLPDAAGDSYDFGVVYLQGVYFILGCGMPLLLVSLLLYVLFVPLQLKMQQRFFTFAGICNAWSALDVFVVSIIAALLEIQQFAAFIIGDSCDGINAWLAEHMDEQLDGDDKCFDVVAELKPEFWSIALAGFLMVAVLYPIIATTDYLVDTRLHEIGLPTGEALAAAVAGDGKSRMVTTSVTHDKNTGEIAEFHEQIVVEEETSCASKWCDNKSLSLKLRMCNSFVKFMVLCNMAEEDEVDRSSYSELSGGESEAGAVSGGDSSLDSIDLK